MRIFAKYAIACSHITGIPNYKQAKTAITSWQWTMRVHRHPDVLGQWVHVYSVQCREYSHRSVTQASRQLWN